MYQQGGGTRRLVAQEGTKDSFAVTLGQVHDKGKERESDVETHLLSQMTETPHFRIE